ncbi:MULTISPECIES: Asp23/Gls24 family envelope stress response protein [Subtercola]|uniref:Asp23/Gls24 family envelope stress response protein n=1 Tax=Subtercola vilae TaxID=2056433 RepID=A0A4T2BRP4_9MICO|nr:MULTISPECIES: Asp23/Gls24 family envelope stress response protein [Subtercola]MEA9986140.1 Asp23/Gls24 family envelope stress response protein [Subtercola sp. RTI3]TIH33572.1 Asp23/Gls24 family envelope stress response protein [Subtercola vilae]
MASTTAASTPTTVIPNSETAIGKTVINDSVVAKVAGIAAREVSGVHALGGGAARALGAIRNVMNNTDLSQGISVEVGETQVAVDVTIVAEYPVPLQTVADGVRSSIIRAIETLVGMEVTEVNVTIDDVYIASDDDTTEPAEARVQ